MSHHQHHIKNKTRRNANNMKRTRRIRGGVHEITPPGPPINGRIYHASVIEPNKIFHGYVRANVIRMPSCRGEQCVPPPPCQYVYTGHGVLIHHDGENMIDHYAGKFENNMRHGVGKIQYQTGEMYHGQWQNDEMHGRGRFRYTNGDFYSGQFEHNEKHGHGVYRYVNGDIYDGDWEHNMMNGHGVYRYANGEVYDGQWQHGRKHGDSTITYPNGVSYNIKWRNGAMDVWRRNS